MIKEKHGNNELALNNIGIPCGNGIIMMDVEETIKKLVNSPC